jgi:hypothetical protein
MVRMPIFDMVDKEDRCRSTWNRKGKGKGKSN